MKQIHTPEELFIELGTLNKDHSVTQFSVPGKGQFTLIFQGNMGTSEEEPDQEKSKTVHENRSDY